MKNLFILVVLGGLLFNCSSEDEELRESNLCECFVLTEVYENSHEDATLLSATTNTVEDSCDKDGLVENTTLEDGNVQIITWNCHLLN